MSSGGHARTERLRRALLRPLFRRFAPSLRLQVALVIAALSFLPNVAVALVLVSAQSGFELASFLVFPLAIWLVLTALLSAGIGYGLSRLLLSPLTELTQEVSALQHESAAGTPRDLRRGAADPKAADPKEVTALREAFSELLAQAELERSRRASFTATLMHDLKTPLIAERHLLTVLRDNDALSKRERVAIADKLLEEKRHIIALVHKMVEAHRVERGEFALRKEPTDLYALAGSVRARLAPLASERGVALLLAGEGVAEADALELERALYNLVDNALRVARARVVLDVAEGAIEVSDDGPGLPAPFDTLAEPFRTQAVAIAGGHYTAGGGGLGLFIARRIVEAHGGLLELVATGDAGTTLRVRL